MSVFFQSGCGHGPFFVGSRACAANHYVIVVKSVRMFISMSTSSASRRHSDQVSITQSL